MMKGYRGFSIVEVLVATVILTFGLFGALELLQNSSRLNDRNKKLTFAAMIAQSRIAELKSLGAEPLRESAGTVIARGSERLPGSPEGAAEITWSTYVDEASGDGIVKVLIEVSFPYQGSTEVRTFESLLSEKS